MSDSKAKEASAAQFDPAALLSLYSSMSAAAAGQYGLGTSAQFGFPAAFANALQAAKTPASSATSSSTSSSAATSTATSVASSFGGLATLGVAASQAASLGMNPANAWWNMASTLAAQDYLQRVQAAARDPAAYAALAAQGVLPNYEMLSKGSKSRSKGTSNASRKRSAKAANANSSSANSSPLLDNLRLPSDTEIIKYTSSSTGPKVPGTSSRGRKKTISLDPSASGSASHADSSFAGSIDSNSSRESTPNIPSGLTIERKRPAGHEDARSSPSSSPMMDRVEITKVPLMGASRAGTSSPMAGFSKASTSSAAESPLNLSLKSTTASSDALTNATWASWANSSLAAKMGFSASDVLGRLAADNIPAEYYASQALSGVFLAEQIRQQQLAAALESRLGQAGSDAAAASISASSRLSSDLTQAMQAALLMNQLRATSSAASAASSSSATCDTSKLLALAAAAAAAAASASSPRETSKSQKKSKIKLTPEELAAAEKSLSLHPELTIEPIFKSLQPQANLGLFGASSSSASLNGSSKKRSLNAESDARSHGKNGGADFGSDTEDSNGAHQDGSSRNSMSRYATIETDELRLPLSKGWRRETVVREYSKSGVRGDVVYYAPCGKKFKQYPDIMRYLEKRDSRGLNRENFSFSTKIFIGDFLKPTGEMMDNGEERYLRLNEQEMLDDVDKIRRENGWKPRRKTLDSHHPTPAQQSSSSQSQSAAGGMTKKQQQQLQQLLLMSGAGGQMANSAMTPEQKLLARLQAEVHLQEELRMQKEAVRYLREAEKLQKLEESRREKEARHQQMLEAKRKKQEQIQRQRHEENMKKVQEREAKRHQAAIVKEQDRDRRRHHLILMKQLECKKRFDERERKKKEFQLEKDKERERKVEQKRLETEIINEMRKPTEDMSLPDNKSLPNLPRIEGLRLCGDAFANVLMVFEFLNTFGERLGFDMESLPTLSELQSALLNDPDAEEELLSVLIHLLVCAIDDPGIPMIHRHLTLLGQNLRQADITNTNVSEILRLYLIARGQVEVKQLHGVIPPETHSTKDRTREIPYCKKRMDEFNKLLHQTRAYKMSLWISEKNFLCLNPTQKSEILAFVCNELLYNRSVVHQIDANMEKVNKGRKVRMLIESKVRRLKVVQDRRFKASNCFVKPGAVGGGGSVVDGDQSLCPSQIGSEVPSEAASLAGDDDTSSVLSESTNDNSQSTSPKKKGAKGRPRKYPPKPTKDAKSKGGKKKDEPFPNSAADEEDEDDAKLDETDLADLEDDGEDDERLSAEELQKKIDKTVKLLVRRRDELMQLNNSLRVADLGQDRFRRRYWHLGHAGGVFVEAMESAEPWKLPSAGMPLGFQADSLESEDEEEAKAKGKEAVSDEPPTKKVKVEDVVEAEEIKDLPNVAKEEVPMEVGGKKTPTNLKAEALEEDEDQKRLRLETEEALKKLGNEILVTPKAEPLASATKAGESKENADPKAEEVDDKTQLFSPKVTPNGEKLNLFNHVSQFHMTPSPVVLNGSVTITPKAEAGIMSHFLTSSPIAQSELSMSSGHGYGLVTSSPVTSSISSLSYGFTERPWFSILPLNGMIENAAKFDDIRREQQVLAARKGKLDLSEIALRLPQTPVNPQIAMLELKLEEVRRANVRLERKPIPKDKRNGWWRVTDPAMVVDVERALHIRGAREQLMLQNFKQKLDFCHEHQHTLMMSLPVPKSLGEPDLGMRAIDGPWDSFKLANGAAPPQDTHGAWSTEVALRVDKYILEQVEALEDKVASASMQVPGWKVPNRPDIEDRSFRAACEPPSGSDDDRPDPISEAKERLLDLEANIERRYLKAPLGHSNAEISLQTITSSSGVGSGPASASKNSTPVHRRTTLTSANVMKDLENSSFGEANGDHDNHNEDDSKMDDDDSSHVGGGAGCDNDESMEVDNNEDEEMEDNNDEDDDQSKSNSPSKTPKENIPRGLATWRQGVRNASTAAQLAMGFYVLETSIAWHKSIMKAYCQLCHCGDDEDSLLLCDGCDKGYHMYCFRPALTSVPDGDWYCFECINKATGVRHCLVCGRADARNLALCTSCPRAYHTDCMSPTLTKVPRGKWQCAGCNQKAPKRKVPKKIKIHIGSRSDSRDEDSSNNANNSNCSTPVAKEQPNHAKEKEKEKEKEKSEPKKEAVEKPPPPAKEKESKEEKPSSPAAPPPPPPTPKESKELAKKAKKEAKALKKASRSEKDLTPCMTVIEELEVSEDSWPFLFPVNTKQFPTYRKIISKPMDIASIKKKLESGAYSTREEFCDDVRLIFSNCEVFNEDDSPVGKAGHAMRNLFNTRWVELIGQDK